MFRKRRSAWPAFLASKNISRKELAGAGRTFAAGMEYQKRNKIWYAKSVIWRIRGLNDIMSMHEIFYWYLAIINIVVLVVYGGDKLFAKLDSWRVPEKVLLLMALFGGSIGALLAMQIFRHKTRHLKFRYGVPVILLLQVAGLVYLHWK